MKFSSLSILCLLPALMLLPARLHAQAGNADLQALRMQIEAMKTEYQTRIESLEKQLEEVQAQMLRLPEPTAAPVAAAAAPTSLSALNPSISVSANFLGRADNQKVFFEGGPTRIDNTFNLREAEIDMRAPVDPYSDAVLITSLESEVPGQFNVSVEEGYLNLRKLPFMQSPLGLKFQIGRFRPAFGKFNTLHTHDLPQSTRSLVTEEFLGEDGFVSQGVSTDFYIPTPWSENESLNARLQVLTGGDVAISPTGITAWRTSATSAGSRPSRGRTTRNWDGPVTGTRETKQRRSLACTPSISCIGGSRFGKVSGNRICWAAKSCSRTRWSRRAPAAMLSVRTGQAFSRNGNSTGASMPACVSITRTRSRTRCCSAKVSCRTFPTTSASSCAFGLTSSIVGATSQPKTVATHSLLS